MTNTSVISRDFYATESLLLELKGMWIWDSGGMMSTVQIKHALLIEIMREL